MRTMFKTAITAVIAMVLDWDGIRLQGECSMRRFRLFQGRRYPAAVMGRSALSSGQPRSCKSPVIRAAVPVS